MFREPIPANIRAMWWFEIVTDPLSNIIWLMFYVSQDESDDSNVMWIINY